MAEQHQCSTCRYWARPRKRTARRDTYSCWWKLNHYGYLVFYSHASALCEDWKPIRIKEELHDLRAT